MNSRSQSGNVLFLILIAVALFAALSYAITNSTRNSSSTSGEGVALQVSSALQQFTGWASAIQKMNLINNCADDEVSVANPQLSNIYGLAAGKRNPARAECKMFDPAGGGQAYNKPSLELNGSRNIGFYANFSIQDIGSINSELIAVIPMVSREFCTLYNEKVGMGPVIPQYTSGPFLLGNEYAGATSLGAGAYTWGGIASRCLACRGKNAFCVEFTNTVDFANAEPLPFPAGYYAFYALWER